MTSVDRLVPLLVYEDIAAAHDFLVDAFGFESGGVERNAEGDVIHGEVRAGATTIWLHRVAEQFQLASARGMAALSGYLIVEVDDVDAHYERVRAAGVRVDGAPEDQPYGVRAYEAWDIEGHRWGFMSPLA
jgi:MerR family transcriptional regulator, thiopeptide resistance regulator